jgi:23S rRNA (uracil1939-C5)-methyltransferase
MPDELFEVELETMAYGGSALGRHEKRVVFIPYTIPGEIVQARAEREAGRVIFAEGVQLTAASADRVLPRCAHFGPGRCGGCHWQHIDPAVQPPIKQDVLADQLERIGGFDDPPVQAIIPAPAAWNYMQRAVWRVGENGKLGFVGAGGGVFSIDECHIIHPDLLALYHQLDLEVSPFKQVELALGEGDQMVTLWAAAEEAPSLELDLIASVNLILPDQAPVNLAGDTHLRYTVREREFRVTAGSAFRANVTALEPLIDAVLTALGNAKSVIDVYAGVGLLGAFAASGADYVTLVESYPPAATDADTNTADLEHVEVIEGEAEEVLEAADPYDAAIVNPPAEGMSTEALDALVALAPETVVYVSDDAATFSRDAKRLARQGYKLASVQPLDLAPQTFTTEIVARFVR